MKRTNFIKSLLAISMMSPLETLANNLSENGTIMPVLFIGHGNPMNAIEDNEFSAYWKKLGKEIPQPTAILCISAHWLTKGTYITAMNNPRTIHDFGGLPQELFDVQYPVPGNPQLARDTKSIITSTEIQLDQEWGLDHGAWSVIKPMYPEANVPVLQMSIDYNKSGQYHYDLAQELLSLRKKGVLIIGSGNMIHNLGMVGAPEGEPVTMENFKKEFGYDWALEMNETFKTHIINKNHQALINYEKMGKSAKMAIPTPDHYYPLLYTLGLQKDNEAIQIFNDKCIGGSLSMTSIKIG